MAGTNGRIDFAAAQPQLDGVTRVDGLDAPVTVRRDGFGIAHIRAENEHDAWFGMGYAAAQDRLWQMDYDRRRATGRWAEVAGGAAVAEDILARRLQLAEAAQVDVASMSASTRGMFEAYAAGVNAYLASGQPLPVEFALTETEPEPWEPWHSVAAFKIRHVYMGKWPLKMAQAALLARIGPERYARLDGRAPAGSPVILPPGGGLAPFMAQRAEDFATAAEQLGRLAGGEGGSNSWAVHGSRTTTGLPVLCNDSHRPLEAPNVYWQAHVAFPEFDVIGAAFAGLPGFPHFGHNGRVAWSITHTGADYQDLYIEQFDPGRPGRYRTREGWSQAEGRSETIAVRGVGPRRIDVWRTAHGPLVFGDPREGQALALRYTAIDEPCRGFEVFRPMLGAATVEELFECQRGWVDPVNNFVAADTMGNIGYMTRGRLPVRSSKAGRQLPAPGWTGEHEWVGNVPFEAMPRAVNPPEGFIATANQAVRDGDAPYIAHEFSPPSRAERIVEVLRSQERFSPAELAALQGDTTSTVARRWARLLERVGPLRGEAELARAMLAGWDGNLRPESGAALLYAHFRRRVVGALFEPLTGVEAWAWVASGDNPSTFRMLGAWFYNVSMGLERSKKAPDGRAWDDVLPEALASAWRGAAERCGEDASKWRWDAAHGTGSQHPLAAVFPEHVERLNPPRAPLGGDGETVQNAGYNWNERMGFDIEVLSVYRQMVDLSEIAHASWAIPGGASGRPGSAHYADQLELWRRHERVPMHYLDTEVAAAAAHRLELRPG